MKYQRLSQRFLLGTLLLTAGYAAAASDYDLEASGKNEAAALGNLKMQALRTEMTRHLSQDEIKSNAKIIRTEIFLKIDDFVSEAGEISYTQDEKKVIAKGRISVDDEKLLAVLGKTPLAKSEGANKVTEANEANETVSGNSGSGEGELSSAGGDNSVSEKSESVTPENQPETTVSAGAVTASGYEALKEYQGEASPEDNDKFRSMVLNGSTKPEDIRKALENGANPNIMVSETFGYSSKLKKQLTEEVPLLYKYVSWQSAKLEVVKLLIEYGAWYNWENPAGTISMAELFLKGREEFLEYWLSLNPDLRRLKNLSLWNVHLEREGEDNQDHLLLDFMQRKDSLKTLDHLTVFNKLLDLGLSPNEKIVLHNCYLPYKVYEKALGGKGSKEDGKKYLAALLDHGADPNLYTSYENSILYLAARDNDAELLKKALARGASITLRDTESYLLIYFSLMYQKAYRGEDGSYSLDFIKAAVDAGGDINFESEDGKRTVAEQFFKRQSSPEIVAYWIGLKPDLKKLKSWDKLKTEALKNWLDFKSTGEPRHLDLTGKLFDLGFDPGVRDGNHLMLERAYEKGGIPYARLFLERGADPNAVNAYKAPLIFWAAETGNPDLLRLFKEFKADFNAVNDHGESVLYDAVSKDEPQMDLIAVLIENGADVNFTRVRNEKSVLMLAVSDRSVAKEDLVDLLLKNGANPNAANSRGRTALMMAVSEPKNPSLKVIESLVNAGAVIDTQDKDTATALSYAIASNHPGAARLLMEKGADPEKALAPGHEMKIGKGKDAKMEYKTLKDLVRETDKPELKELKELLAKYL